MEFEGGFSDHAADTGGKTRYGITERTARRNGYAGPMESLPRELAREIYRREYWKVLNLSAIHNQDVAAFLFDMSVNHGPEGATRVAQRAANDLGKGLRVDGAWGPRTKATIQSLATRYPQGLLGALKTERGIKFKNIMAANPSQKVFARGWFARCA
jgi:lysozyme family protein